MNDEQIADGNSLPEQPSAAASKEKLFDNLYCSTCQARKSDSELMKTPIDYIVNTDGSSVPVPERYSLFCGKCQQFLGIYDPQVQNELAEMKRIREGNETTGKK